MDGILIIDKPQGITSHDVVRRVRRVLKTRRVGHAGTLDPLATGVLPVAVGEGTRIVEFLMAGGKTYRATLKLGEITDSQDAEGTVLEQRTVPDFTPEEIERVCGEFVGDLRQVPPMYSALKKNGVPLYRLARRGIEVERAAREVRIERICLQEVRLPFVTVEVDCSKGTYIRTLCHDIGEALGPGAHLTALRRLRNGFFDAEESVALDEIEAASSSPPLLSLAEGLRGFPALQVSSAALRRLQNGIPPTLSEVSGIPECAEGELLALLNAETLAAVARFAPQRQREKRGDFELVKVFTRPSPG